ncbi:MAG: hypothetical protein GY809_27440, partial [Planctomycetes bacterium]|nr:hypothetical protein [Planctomycetota bacterium]
MDIVAGARSLDAPGWRLELPLPRMKSLNELRVALISDHSVMPVDQEIAERVTMVEEVLAKLGAKVSNTARPDFVGPEGHDTYLKLLRAIVGGPEDSLDHKVWMGLDNKRTYYRQGWKAFFQEWDLLVCPIMPTTAFLHDHGAPPTRTIVVNGESQPYWNQVFWAGLATLSYLPSTVFPTGLSGEGLPIGLQ